MVSTGGDAGEARNLSLCRARCLLVCCVSRETEAGQSPISTDRFNLQRNQVIAPAVLFNAQLPRRCFLPNK